MFFRLPHIYLKIKTNKVWAKHLESQTVVELYAQEPFTTERLLVGNFDAALSVVQIVVNRVYSARIKIISPAIVIHPLEHLEGGLSPVEKQTFFNLAVSCGASEVQVWEGNELTDMEVVALFQSGLSKI